MLRADADKLQQVALNLLGISRDLARGMGGDLTLRSVEGEGSTFTVMLERSES